MASTKVDLVARLNEAGPSVTLRTATEALTIGYSTGVKLAAAGEFPVRVIRVGTRWRVPTSELKSLLGLAS